MHINVYGDTLCAQVTATAFAQNGNTVTWYVPDEFGWDALEQGAALYKEPGLRFLLEQQRKSGRLSYRLLDVTQPPRPADVVFLALQPGQLSLAEQLVERYAGLGKTRVVANQTVFPIGTTEQFQALVLSINPDSDMVMVSLPDLLQEGNAYETFTRPDSVLLGCEDEGAERVMRELLRPFNRRHDVIQRLSLREAELAKLAISGMLATRISYMNDMAQLAESVHVDIDRIRSAMGADPRIGTAYLYPGCGFGGPGLSGNVMTLADTLRAEVPSSGLLDQVLRINEFQKETLFRKFWQHFGGDVAGMRVAIWGVAFKPATHRVDNSPALKLIEALWAQGVTVAVNDPMAMPELARWAAEHNGEIEFHQDPYEAAARADAVMMVTEWKPYWNPDWEKLRQVMRYAFVLDGRNIYDPAYVREQGLVYCGIGRK